MGPTKHFMNAQPTDKASLEGIGKLSPRDAETLKKRETWTIQAQL